MKTVLLQRLLFFFSLLLISACKPTEPNVKSTNQNSFIYGPKATEDATYTTIKGTLPRLHAILAGKFVQQNTARDPEGKEYKTWLVNEGKDSVLIYHIPAGDPEKDGYWMYNCQIMTSLPNEPLHANLSLLSIIDRDTIQSTSYPIPINFHHTLNDVLKNPEKAFKTIDFKALSQTSGQKQLYIRESPIHYKSEMPLISTINKEGTKQYRATYFLIRPQMIAFGFNIYDEHKNLLEKTPEERLVKQAMVSY